MGNVADAVVNCKFDLNSDDITADNIYPTEDLILDALVTNDFSKLNKAIVIPVAKANEATSRNILFESDYWTNTPAVTKLGEPKRSVLFSELNGQLKLETKIIALSFLWLVGYGGKLTSMLRKGEQLVYLAKILQNMNVPSFTWLDRAPIRDEFLTRLEMRQDEKKKAPRTIRVYLAVLSDICLLSRRTFGKCGYTLETNFLEFCDPDARNKAVQTYCMPLNFLFGIWNGIMEYFGDLNDIQKLNELRELMSIFHGFKEYGEDIKHCNSDQWKHAINLYYQKNAQEALERLFNNGSPFIKRFIRYRKPNINQRKPGFYRVHSRGIRSFYAEYQLYALNGIQSMTGMRISETNVVAHNSLIEEDDYIGVKAQYHKFAPEGGLDEDWAAAPYVKDIFDIVTSLNSVIFNISKNDLKDRILFFNHDHLLYNNEFVLKARFNNSDWSRKFVAENKLLITDDYLKEFHLYNKNIGRKSKIDEEIYHGAPWPLRSHQYRRSIAVHSKRLKLVSNNTLAQQFKHLSLTMTEWYSDGWENTETTNRHIPEEFAKELEALDLEIAAETAMKFQEGEKLIGEGGKTLMEQRQRSSNERTFPSLKSAISMAKRGSIRVMSLGNGFYCMNGTTCEFKPVVQSSSCNKSCPSMVADADSIPIWLDRYNHYNELVLSAKAEDQSKENIEFLQLECDFYEDALNFYGVNPNE